MMVRIIPAVRLLSSSLLLFPCVTSSTLKNEPQLRSNATLKLAHTATLNARDLFGLVDRASSYYSCDPGYSECAYDTSRCCPSDTSCCGNGYCADPGDVCCTSGTCPSGWNCCGDYCSPVGGECCTDGHYCMPGKHCRIWDGEKVCCPTSGCVGEYDSGGLGSTVTAMTSVTETTTATITAAPTSTYSYTYGDYEYYYTTYYWTYWFYFWTTYYPYTVKTVTSTETTTSTVWSVYETDSNEASSSLSSSAEMYTFSTPYSATYLKSSSRPVPLATGAASSPTTTFSTSNEGGGFGRGGNSASGVSANEHVALMGAILAGLVGGLAFGL